MATTVTNMDIVEIAQEIANSETYAGYLPNALIQIDSGAAEGDTVTVPLVTAAAAADFNAATNNYLTESGSIAGIKVVLNKRKLSPLGIAQSLNGKVGAQNAIRGGIYNIAKAMAADLFGVFTAASFTTTPVVVGVAANFDYIDWVALKDNIDSLGLDPMNIGVALPGAYIKGVESHEAVWNAKGADLLSQTNSAFKSRIDGMWAIRTTAVPAGTNIVGAMFDNTAAAIAMGSTAPFAENTTTFYQEIVSEKTGFRFGIREVVNVATGSKVVSIESVYGVKAANTAKGVLLASA